MNKPAAALASAVFFVLAPGIVAGLVPWYVTDGWTRNDPRGGAALAVAGCALVVAGATALVATFVRYVIEGNGTPAPVAPTERLVVRGLNRYVRNPMYVAVVTLIVGEALVLARLELLVYGAVAFATMAAFAYGYEEPHLRDRYGEEYDAYRRSVGAWIPRRPRR